MGIRTPTTPELSFSATGEEKNDIFITARHSNGNSVTEQAEYVKQILRMLYNKTLRPLLFLYLLTMGGWYGGFVFLICEDGKIERGALLFGCPADSTLSVSGDATERESGFVSSLKYSCGDFILISSCLNVNLAAARRVAFKGTVQPSPLFDSSFPILRGIAALSPVRLTDARFHTLRTVHLLM